MEKKYFNDILNGHAAPLSVEYYKSVDWNRIEDALDKATWEKLTSQFWLDTRIPVSNDRNDWRMLSPEEQDVVNKAFVGLTLLDTLQSEEGANVMRDDVRTQHEEAVLNNILFMECYTKGHQLLTPNGWVEIENIEIGDTVLAYDKETNSKVFQKVTNASNYKPDEVYSVGTGTKELLRVSKGHRMYYEEKIKKSNECKDWVSNIALAEEFIELPKTYHRRLRHNTPNFLSNLKSPLTNEERVMIMFQADGSISEREKSNMETSDTVYVRISIEKKRKIERAFKLLESIDCKHNRTQDGFGARLDKNIIDSNKKLHSVFSIERFDTASAREFIDEISFWDSYDSRREEGPGNYMTYYSADKENADFVSAVAVLAGYPVRTGTVEDYRKCKDYSESHYVRVLFNEASLYTTFQNFEHKVLPGEQVFGVEVPSGYLIVKNGDQTTISGNSVHAKSYSTIFISLNTSKEIDAIFDWGNTNPLLQYKAQRINEIYQNGTSLQKKAASVFLESFLFYSGFYAPLWYLGNNKLENVAEIIKLIIRDESVHGTYLGYKFQLGFNELPETEANELTDWVYELLFDLMENEERYTEEIYTQIGWVNDVKTFIKYNANKALQNLGFEAFYEEGLPELVNPIVMNGISTESSNHDFFSQVGNSYLMGESEAMEEDDYDF